MTNWHRFNHEDKTTYPSIAGTYAVMIAGDSERDGPHVFYSFEDYQTFAEIKAPDEDGEQAFKGMHDEENETVIAWYGPIVIPPFDKGE